jgi:hypothetical protein
MPSYRRRQTSWAILATGLADYSAKAPPPDVAFSAAATGNADRDRRDVWLMNMYASAQLDSYT